MCTYLTEHVALSGSAKGQLGWFPVSTASVYFDHPFDAPFEHALCIDVLDPASGPAARVAVELDPAAARALAEAILATLASAESMGALSAH
ncbi:MAG TPA: DUF6295 family protein [Acidimicrobiales bacterium]|nr:DUF6295 family protein [Acidimicrobiales bacterium]